MSVTISSSVLVGASETPSSRFTDIVLSHATNQSPVQLRNRIVSGRPALFTFRGSGLVGKAGALEAVECRGLIGPRANMSGKREAVTRYGELVTIGLTMYDGTEDGDELSAYGVITDLSLNVGPSSEVLQSLDFVFHPCDRLRFINETTYLTNPSAV